MIEEYNKRISKVIMDYYKDAGVVGSEPQVDLTRLTEKDKLAVVEDLQGAISTLNKWYKDTEKN